MYKIDLRHEAPCCWELEVSFGLAHNNFAAALAFVAVVVAADVAVAFDSFAAADIGFAHRVRPSSHSRNVHG